MAKVALLTLHGMGVTRVGYAKELLDALGRRLAARFAEVAVQRVYYQKALQASEDAVWNRMSEDALRYDDLRKFLLFGFADAAGLESRKELPGSAYEDAQIEIAQKMLRARDELGGDGPLIVVSHSLGCQVFSCYLYDASKRDPIQTPGIWKNIDSFANRIAGRALTPDEKAFLSGSTLRRWVTTGCNIPIFVAAHQSVNVKPIVPLAADFKWLNLHDPDDVLGWPLRPLLGGYETLVEDRSMNAGRGVADWILKSWNPMSHGSYWDDNDVLDPIEAMLREFL